MSLYNYKNAPIRKRTETIEVSAADFPQITDNPYMSRVKKVLAIRREVRSAYLIDFKEAEVHFVDGSLADLMATESPTSIPKTLVFEVILHMPLVQPSTAVGCYKGADGLKTYDYKRTNQDSIPPTWRKDNDHIYWS
tara:strand:+ start:8189 stop:8599 length:411 start_codon:yes stop_codon:yes gene_type:complete